MMVEEAIKIVSSTTAGHASRRDPHRRSRAADRARDHAPRLRLRTSWSSFCRP